MNTEYKKFQEFIERLLVITKDEMLALFSEFKITAPLRTESVAAALNNPAIGEKFKKRLYQVAKIAETRDSKAFAMNSGATADAFSDPLALPNIAPAEPTMAATTTAVVTEEKSGGFTWDTFNDLMTTGAAIYTAIQTSGGKAAPQLTNTTTTLPASTTPTGFDFSFKNPVVIALLAVIVLALIVFAVKSRKSK